MSPARCTGHWEGHGVLDAVMAYIQTPTVISIPVRESSIPLFSIKISQPSPALNMVYLNIVQISWVILYTDFYALIIHIQLDGNLWIAIIFYAAFWWRDVKTFFSWIWFITGCVCNSILLFLHYIVYVLCTACTFSECVEYLDDLHVSIMCWILYPTMQCTRFDRSFPVWWLNTF